MQIKFESVNHIYNANTPMEQRALYDINFDIKDVKLENTEYDELLYGPLLYDEE